MAEINRPTALYDYFYDGQIRRFLVQFIRVMSGFQVEYGKNDAGLTTLQRVPVYYGDGSRQAQTVLSNNSASTAPATPAMVVYISNLTYDRERMQDPTFVDKKHFRQREYDKETKTYTQRQGDAVTVERLMPVPYQLELKLEVWTTSTEQKLQLLEQMYVLFNPGLEIQSTDNFLDWTSLSVIYLDAQSWSSRSVPSGTDTTSIDVSSATFKLPIWITTPAKVKRLGVIQRIISTLHDASAEDLESAVINETNLLGQRQCFTPLDYHVMLVNNELTLLKHNEIEWPRDETVEVQSKIGTKDTWLSLINIYGVLDPNISQVRLQIPEFNYEIVGSIAYTTDPTKLKFYPDIDTLPPNTLKPVNAIVNPNKQTAVDYAQIAVVGTRYLILGDIGSWNNADGLGAVIWRGVNSSEVIDASGMDLVAHANDIIEFNGNHWVVSYDSRQMDRIDFVSSLSNSTQYKWNGKEWSKSVDGMYSNGDWSLVI